MRIVILSFFTGLVERGVEVYVQELAERLSLHHHVEVVTAADIPFPIKPYTNTEPQFLRRLYLDPKSLRLKKATEWILDKLAASRPDILYPVNNGWQSILSKRFCQKHKTKLILAGHSGPGRDDRVNLWLKPDAFITFSPVQAAWAEKQSRGVNVVTIPHAIDLKQFNPQTKPKNLKLPKPIFVTVSALPPKSRGGETVKNIEATIKAVSNLPKGSLLLIGQGNQAENLDELAKKHLGPNRYQRLKVSHNEMPQYYTASTIFTLASSASEAFGLVYLEALACNLPVVTVDDPLRRFIIGNAGIYIKDPNDTTEYSQGLFQALSRDWGHKPRLQAQKFSWEHTIGQYEKLLNNLA